MILSDIILRLYHVAERKNMYSIMHNGIKPKRGGHTILTAEPDSVSIPDMLDPVVLEVDATGLDIRPVSSGMNYGIYYTTHIIRPDKINYERFG